MPASPQRHAAMPWYRTSAALKGFVIGMESGMLATLCALAIVTYVQSPGEGQSRADATAWDEGGTRVIPASFCDVFQEFAETRGASAPVRFRVCLSRIVDGDTIRVIWHGENLPVRLLGINAPERRRAGGAESAACLRALLVGVDTVDLEFERDFPQRDSLGRLLAFVWRGDSLLNLEMVTRGHAGLYKGGGAGRYGDALRLAAERRAGFGGTIECR